MYLKCNSNRHTADTRGLTPFARIDCFKFHFERLTLICDEKHTAWNVIILHPQAHCFDAIMLFKKPHSATEKINHFTINNVENSCAA